MQRPLPAASLLALLLPASGCCTLTRLWCGPERSPWISISFATHEQALRTLMEAIRRDSPLVIYQSLSERLKRRLGVQGPMEAAIAWQRLNEQARGVHMLGTAAVSEPTRMPDGRMRYDLTVAGHGMRVVLVRQPFVEVEYRDDGELVPAGSYVTDLPAHVALRGGRFVVRPGRGAELPTGLTADRIERLEAGHDWKVDALSSTPEEADGHP